MRDWIIEKILAPSRRLDLILDLDVLRDTVEVRSTIIYETVSDKRIVVAQTSPPILNSRVGQQISATYLAEDHESGERERYGFKTKILRFIKEYRLRRGVKVQALALSYPRSEMVRTQARLLHRVELIPGHGLSLLVRGLEEREEVALLDLSLGGFLFSHKGYQELKAGQRIKVGLVRNGSLLRIRARVVRVFERVGARFLFVGCAFDSDDPEETAGVRELVVEIMRQELKDRSGLFENPENPDMEDPEKELGEPR